MSEPEGVPARACRTDVPEPFTGWRHPFIDAAIATDLDKLMADRFIIGGPEECIAQIRRFVDAYGMTHLICRTFFPGMPHAHIMRELELLAREVMPAFR